MAPILAAPALGDPFQLQGKDKASCRREQRWARWGGSEPAASSARGFSKCQEDAGPGTKETCLEEVPCSVGLFLLALGSFHCPNSLPMSCVEAAGSTLPPRLFAFSHPLFHAPSLTSSIHQGPPRLSHQWSGFSHGSPPHLMGGATAVMAWHVVHRGSLVGRPKVTSGAERRGEQSRRKRKSESVNQTLAWHGLGTALDCSQSRPQGRRARLTQGRVLSVPCHRAAGITLGMPHPWGKGAGPCGQQHTDLRAGSCDSRKAHAIPVLSKRSPLGRGQCKGLFSFPLPSPGLHFSSD